MRDRGFPLSGGPASKTYMAIGQEETDEDLASFFKYAVVQIDDYSQMPTCVIGPFDSRETAGEYLEDGMNFAIVEIIPPNLTKLRMMREYRAQNTPNKDSDA